VRKEIWRKKIEMKIGNVIWSLKKHYLTGSEWWIYIWNINLMQAIVVYGLKTLIRCNWSLSIDEKDEFHIICRCLVMRKLNFVQLIFVHWWERWLSYNLPLPID
jgi:hypothetical protein